MAFYTLNQILDIGTVLQHNQYSQMGEYITHISDFDYHILDISRVATLFLVKVNQEYTYQYAANHILQALHCMYMDGTLTYSCS